MQLCLTGLSLLLHLGVGQNRLENGGTISCLAVSSDLLHWFLGMWLLQKFVYPLPVIKLNIWVANTHQLCRQMHFWSASANKHHHIPMMHHKIMIIWSSNNFDRCPGNLVHVIMSNFIVQCSIWFPINIECWIRWLCDITIGLLRYKYHYDMIFIIK